MDISKAYATLANYLLFDKENNGYLRVLDIKEKYEKFRYKVAFGVSHATKRLNDILKACDLIEKTFQDEIMQKLDERERINAEYRPEVERRERMEIIALSTPVPTEAYNNPILIELFEQEKAITHKQKIRAIQKNSKRKILNFCYSNEMLEPSWKRRQRRLVANARFYLTHGI